MPANYTHTTRATGLTLTAAIYNADHQNHIDNMIPGIIDDYSVNVAQMQETLDPGEVGTENPAASLAEELKQLRFCLKELKGTTHWYESVASSIAFLAANTFTGLQRIVRAVAGNFLELESTEAGATSGPNIEGYRNSASPAAADFGMNINYYFKDSGGNKQFFGQIYSKMMDPTNGSEDGLIGIGTMRAGVQSDWAFESGTLRHVGRTVPAEDGAFNPTKLYVNDKNARVVAQQVVATNATYQTCTTDLPLDNTIPQVTEGDEILTSGAFTPQDANSLLEITISMFAGVSSASSVGVALFSSASANALDARAARIEGSTSFATFGWTYTTTAGAGARTYSVRLGPEVGGAASARLNGDGSARVFGGIATARLVVKELLPA